MLRSLPCRTGARDTSRRASRRSRSCASAVACGASDAASSPPGSAVAPIVHAPAVAAPSRSPSTDARARRHCSLALVARSRSRRLPRLGRCRLRRPPSRLAKALRSPHVSLERTSAIAVDAPHRHGRLRAQRVAAGRARVEREAARLVGGARAARPRLPLRDRGLGAGSRGGAVWHGDLYLKGHGDPTLASSDVARFAAPIRARGFGAIRAACSATSRPSTRDATWPAGRRTSSDSSRRRSRRSSSIAPAAGPAHSPPLLAARSAARGAREARRDGRRDDPGSARRRPARCRSRSTTR